MKEFEFKLELHALVESARQGGLEDGDIARELRSKACLVGQAWSAELDRRITERVAEGEARYARRMEERARANGEATDQA